MNTQPIRLIVSDLPLAVCRLGRADPIPGSALQGAFFSITRTAEELSEHELGRAIEKLRETGHVLDR